MYMYLNQFETSNIDPGDSSPPDILNFESVHEVKFLSQAKIGVQMSHKSW